MRGLNFLGLLFLVLGWITPVFSIGVATVMARNGDRKMGRALAAFAFGVAMLGLMLVVSDGFRRSGDLQTSLVTFLVGNAFISIGGWWLAFVIWGVRNLSDLKRFWPFGK